MTTPRRHLFNNTSTNTIHTDRPTVGYLMVSRPHQQCRTPLQTRVRASLVERAIGRPKDWGYKACISTSISTSTSTIISISISTSTSIHRRSPCRT